MRLWQSFVSLPIRIGSNSLCSRIGIFNRLLSTTSSNKLLLPLLQDTEDGSFRRDYITSHLLNASKEELQMNFNKTPGSVPLAIMIREDLATMMRKESATEKNETHIKENELKKCTDLNKWLLDWMSAVFCIDSLSLRRITFDSGGSILEKVSLL